MEIMNFINFMNQTLSFIEFKNSKNLIEFDQFFRTSEFNGNY